MGCILNFVWNKIRVSPWMGCILNFIPMDGVYPEFRLERNQGIPMDGVYPEFRLERNQGVWNEIRVSGTKSGYQSVKLFAKATV